MGYNPQMVLGSVVLRAGFVYNVEILLVKGGVNGTFQMKRQSFGFVPYFSCVAVSFEMECIGIYF